MIHELIERLKTRAKQSAAILRAKLAEAAHAFAPTTKTLVHACSYIVAAEGNVLDMGKRYRKTSGHSPLFSLFTFFASRQITP